MLRVVGSLFVVAALAGCAGFPAPGGGVAGRWSLG